MTRQQLVNFWNRPDPPQTARGSAETQPSSSQWSDCYWRPRGSGLRPHTHIHKEWEWLQRNCTNYTKYWSFANAINGIISPLHYVKSIEKKRKESIPPVTTKHTFPKKNLGSRYLMDCSTDWRLKCIKSVQIVTHTLHIRLHSNLWCVKDWTHFSTLRLHNEII